GRDAGAAAGSAVTSTASTTPPRTLGACIGRDHSTPRYMSATTATCSSSAHAIARALSAVVSMLVAGNVPGRGPGSARRRRLLRRAHQADPRHARLLHQHHHLVHRAVVHVAVAAH